MWKLEFNGMLTLMWKKVGGVPSWSGPEQQMSWAFVHGAHSCQLAILPATKEAESLFPYTHLRARTSDLRKVSFNQEKGFFSLSQYGNDFRMTDIHQWRYYILPKT